jgi:hypothetical protein
MPSITLPTPNSSNNGKVLVSNGSGYALENSGARNQNYISIYGLTAAMNISGINKIEGWNVNNLINIGSGFTFSDANNTITIKNVGYYKIKANITFYITSGGTNNERSLKVQIYINDSAVGPPMMGNLIHAEGDNNYATVPCEYIAHITSINSVIDIRVSSSSNNAADVYEQTPYWLIEDMTPSAVPSINIPLPVAAHAGKALTVNSAGNALEYSNPGVIKEYISEFCNGQTITTKSGVSLTLQNVTAVQPGETHEVDVNGSSVSYKPPSGTTNVIYEFHFQHSFVDGHSISAFIFYIDNVEQTNTRTEMGNYVTGNKVSIKVPIKITGTTSATDCTVSDWNSTKTLKLTYREHHLNNESKLFETRYWYGSSSTYYFVSPVITLIAI